MSQLLLVRHGQARFMSDDYDRLSPLGVAQAEALAEYWLERDVRPDEVVVGSLQRQRASAAAVCAVFERHGVPWPAVRTLNGLDEYPAHDILARVGPALRRRDERIAKLADAFEAAGEADRSRLFQRWFAAVMACWLEGATDGDLDMSWASWSAGVRDALATIVDQPGRGRTVAAFTSGGVIGTLVQHALSAPPQQSLELNWQLLNASVTRFAFNASRLSMQAFNDAAHLPQDMQTYR